MRDGDNIWRVHDTTTGRWLRRMSGPPMLTDDETQALRFNSEESALHAAWRVTTRAPKLTLVAQCARFEPR